MYGFVRGSLTPLSRFCAWKRFPATFRLTDDDGSRIDGQHRFAETPVVTALTQNLPGLAGFPTELRDLPLGGVLSRAARVPVRQRASLHDWRKNTMAAVAKAAGTFTAQTLDAVDETFDHAVRVIVIVRTA